MTKNLLEADGIILEFGLRKILTDIYIKSETNVITGILGRNGAGKTCLMKIIFGHIEPQSKSVRINGSAIFGNQAKRIKYLPQHNFIPKNLRLNECIGLFGIHADNLVSCFPEFDDLLSTRIKHLSGGQARLFEILLVLLSDAKFVLLDEPFTHIAPAQVERLIELINIEKEKKGILITDHLHQHITRICDHIYLIKDSKTHLIKDKNQLIEHGYIN